MRRWFFILAILCLLSARMVLAQETGTVPDVTGMTVPAATAALNRVGIAVSGEINEPPSGDANVDPNTVISQSITPGTVVETGMSIELTVLRAPNTLLIYDDNDLTLVNQSGSDLALSGIAFQALDGNNAAFDAGQWGAALRAGDCAQLWSINRTSSKAVGECQSVEHWRATTNSQYHFWTGAGGTTRFSIIQNGVERGVCMVANPGRCDVYLPSNGSTNSDATDYVYIAYTQDRLAVINNTDNLWMSLSGLVFLNNAVEPPGQAVIPTDASLYGSNINPAADLQRLAPGQCILFTNNPEIRTPPQPCDVIAWIAVNPKLIFWAKDFPVESATDDLQHACPAGKAEGMILCIMPR